MLFWKEQLYDAHYSVNFRQKISEQMAEEIH
jgi:hypothetical protein